MEIKANDKNIIIVNINDFMGNSTQNKWIFDCEDIELFDRYEQSLEEFKKVKKWFDLESVVVEKKDSKEEKKAFVKEFYKRGMKAYDIFLGEDGCKKFLCGRNPYYTMFIDINNAIEQILPEMKKSFNDIKNMIKSKYSVQEDDLLE